MLKTHMAACLVATALMAAPAAAQTTTAPATNPPTSGMSTPKVNAADFVNQAANSDLFEIQSSQLAQSKTQDSRVREFAQHMVQDHTQASEKLKAAAQSMTVPTSLDQEHAKMLQQLQEASGTEFTRNYVQMQFMGHQKAVALFDSYAQSGDNPQLKQFAEQTVPTLRTHLQQITRIRQDMLGQNQARSPDATGTGFITEARPDLWRASKLTGLNIYNESDEKIGDINEVLINREGKAEALVIGVGGFLGMGEHDVAVPFSALQWQMTDRSATAAGTAGPASSGTGTAGMTATTANPSSPAGTGGVSATGATTSSGAGSNRGFPERAVLPNASKDQLKNAPQFRYEGSR
jgi:predicted outer membrane protein